MKQILFFDAETVPIVESFDLLDPDGQAIWADIAKRKILRNDLATDEEIADLFWDRAALYPEFGKIVCISVGAYHNGEFVTKSYIGDEVDILAGFFETVENKYNTTNSFFCGHNIKNFDVKFICRKARMFGISIPNRFNALGKKPWELPHLDTMELWRFGDFKDYTSLKMLCYALGIKTPKDDIDGSQVKDVYYKEDDIKRITTYCEKDVIAEKECYEKIVGS